MPVASIRTEPGSQVLDAMSDTTTSSTTANDLDLIYLKGIMESPVEQEKSLKEARPSPVRENNMELLQEILSELDPFKQNCNTAAELTHILTQPHFQSLLETHDSVAAQACDSPPPAHVTLWTMKKTGMMMMKMTMKAQQTTGTPHRTPSAWWGYAKWPENTWE
ncbi:hypothetical protein CesoFtcFv8_019334 [Champsocephalus esox]|uniref:L27 domain-containing protein n=1 Tax=Champsocephalus esox TaxID=159716 RepID=A0AAN8GQS1_9TELE|nr:hypothetical protein CesoFtcFv8_019334 [Champsocephalus esox]